MASENEPAKLLLPYLQRADELQKHEPLVAYYCRLYAMERGLKIPQNERTKTTNSLLISLMKQLEKDKKSLQLGSEDNLYLEGFALNVFGKAEKQDHAGRADLTTAKTFYAASIFFEILNQFGVVQPDVIRLDFGGGLYLYDLLQLEQKQKYAAWKAADIRKALKEGRKPQAGPPAGDDDLSLPSSGMSGSYDLGPGDAAVTSPGSQSDPSPQFHDEVNRQHSIKSAPPQFQDQHSSNITPYEFHDDAKFQRSTSLQSPPKFHDEVNGQHSTNNASPPPQSYPTAGYSSHDFHPPPPTNRPETSDFSQPYHRQSYLHEPQQPLPPNYPPQESNYPYPNFQSYPSFTETNIPAVSSHYPSYYQGSDPSYSPQSAPSTTDHPSTAQYQTSNRNGTVSEPTPAPPPAKTYQYDSSYQPSPEKIAEAHKAARFAVGALAFDDVSVAVDHLIKSLELLTNPSAGQ